MTVGQSFKELLKIESGDIFWKRVTLLKNFEKVDFSHFEDDGIDFGSLLQLTSLKTKGGSLKNINDIDDVWMASYLLHVLCFSHKDVGLFENLDDDFLSQFSLSDENGSLGSGFGVFIEDFVVTDVTTVGLFGSLFGLKWHFEL